MPVMLGPVGGKEKEKKSGRDYRDRKALTVDSGRWPSLSQLSAQKEATGERGKRFRGTCSPTSHK